MTLTQAEQIIKDAVRTALPSVFELKFGCRLKKGKYTVVMVRLERFGDKGILVLSSGNDWHLIFDGKNDPLESLGIINLGSPITLTDILATIGKTERGQNIAIQAISGHFMENREDEIGEAIEWCETFSGDRIRWEFTKHLENQSDETKLFLANLLK